MKRVRTRERERENERRRKQGKKGGRLEKKAEKETKSVDRDVDFTRQVRWHVVDIYQAYRGVRQHTGRVANLDAVRLAVVDADGRKKRENGGREGKEGQRAGCDIDETKESDRRQRDEYRRRETKKEKRDTQRHRKERQN